MQMEDEIFRNFQTNLFADVKVHLEEEFMATEELTGSFTFHTSLFIDDCLTFLSRRE